MPPPPRRPAVPDLTPRRSPAGDCLATLPPLRRLGRALAAHPRDALLALAGAALAGAGIAVSGLPSVTIVLGWIALVIGLTRPFIGRVRVSLRGIDIDQRGAPGPEEVAAAFDRDTLAFLVRFMRLLTNGNPESRNEVKRAVGRVYDAWADLPPPERTRTALCLLCQSARVLEIVAPDAPPTGDPVADRARTLPFPQRCAWLLTGVALLSDDEAARTLHVGRDAYASLLQEAGAR